MGGLRTFGNLVDGDLIEVHLLCVRAQRDFRITKEVFSDLRLAELLEVGLVSIDTSTGLVKFDDGDNIVGACLLAVEFSHHVAGQPFGAKHNDDVDCDRH